MAKKNGKLSDAHKAFLVQRLACFDSPKEAAEALKAEHGVVVSPQAAEHYDPTKKAGASLAERYRTLFEETRKRFLEKLEDLPEANKAVRIRHLAHAARTFKANGNYIGMANMLKQIAEEVGNVYTNRREHTGKDGGPIQYEDMSQEQVDRELAQMLAGYGLTRIPNGEEGPPH